MKELFQGHVGTEGQRLRGKVTGFEMGNVQNGILTSILLVLFLAVLTKKACGHIKG